MVGRREPGPRVHLEPGDVAPDFVLKGSDGRDYTLSALRGHMVVTAWFPKAFTSGCASECRSMGLNKRSLAGFDAYVFAASCDSVEDNRAFGEATGIGVPILSDPGKMVARAYGVLGSMGLPNRWTIYIGPDGRIATIDREVRTGTHGVDIAATLEKLGVSRRP
jgi:peroxiredoxin Q/BCP